MPAQADLGLYDAQATPVLRTFKAAGVSNGIAKWLEKTASVISGYLSVTFGMQLPTKAADPVRHKLVLKTPTTATETTNGVARQIVTRQSMATVDVIIAPDSTLQERKDLMKYLSNLVDPAGTVNFGNQVVNTEPTT